MRRPVLGLAVSIIALVLLFGAKPLRAEDALPPPGHLNDPVTTSVPANGSAAPADGLPAPGHLTDGAAPSAGKDPADKPEAAAATSGDTIQPASLQLEVSINGYKVNLVAGFNPLPGGGLSSARAELRDIGIKAPGQGPDTEQISLSSIPGLSYSFDQAALTIDLRVPDGARIPKSYDILPKQDMTKATGDYGFVMNYSAYAAANTMLTGIDPNFTGASVNFDARAYAPFGVLQQTASVGTTTFSDFTATRLDTSWTSSSQERAETYRAGDFISGGMNWSRPVRMGGLQAQRDFGLRPDLVTTPLANLKGTAAVPSTLDVYVNGTKTFSQDVPQGPFEINRLPVISSQGTAQIVVTDPNGRQSVTEQSVYSSPLLLSPKLFDYSVELGFARRNYGIADFDYDDELMAIVGARYGVTKSLTGEFHLEAKQDLIDLGLGAVLQAGPLGTFNLAGAVSDFQGKIGYYSYGAWDWSSGSLMIHASSARSFGDFADLAAATAVTAPSAAGFNLAPLLAGGVPKAVDQAGLSWGITSLDATLGLNAVHFVPSSGDPSLILSASASKTFGNRVTVFAAAYKDFEQDNSFGAQLGFSMPLGGAEKNISISSSAIYDNTGPSLQASAVKPMDTSYGSLGWRVNAVQNQDRDLSASASYRAQHAVVSGSVENFDQQVRGDLRLDGALIAAKPGVFLSNPVTDSFIVVDTGAPDVGVNYENRYVGKTDKNGKLVLTQVPSYRPTKVSIDPLTLPLNANVTEVDKKVAPRARSGAVVDFAVKTDTNSALVILKDTKGDFVAPGTLVSVDGTAEPSPMGYDGQVYLTGLNAKNTLHAEVAGQSCSASFDYKEDNASQVVIGPLTCG